AAGRRDPSRVLRRLQPPGGGGPSRHSRRDGQDTDSGRDDRPARQPGGDVVNEQDRDLTGAWALNALDAEERARIEELFAQDPEAAGEARSFEETAAELAAGLEPEAPRPELKSSLMARIARTPQHSVESSGP